MEIISSFLSAIAEIGKIIIAIIERVNKKETTSENYQEIIIVPAVVEEKDEDDIVMIGTENMDKMPVDSEEYRNALATKGKMSKNKGSVFEVYFYEEES